MGNESSKQPGSPAGHKGTGSNVSGVMMPTGGGRKSSNGEPDEYCWATGYWTVMHDSGSSDAAAPPFTVYKSNPCEDFQGETIVQRLGNVSCIFFFVLKVHYLLPSLRENFIVSELVFPI